MVHQKVQRSPDTKKRFFYGYIVVIVSLCVFAVMYGMRFAFGVFFKPMLTDFGWTRVLTSSAFSLSMLVEGLLAIVMGSLNDRLGPRVVLTLCGFLLGIGCLFMSQISTLWQIYLFYGVIIGVGMSGVLVPLLSTIARWFIKRRNVMTGIALTGVGLGTLISPPVATRLISVYNWRVSYIILGCFVFAVAVLAAQFLKRDPRSAGHVPYGEDDMKEHKLKGVDEGLSLREATHTKQFWMAFGIFICWGFSYYSIVVHIVPHITDLGISAAKGASILAVLGGAGIVGNVLGGAADRIGNKQACIIGLLLASAMLFWLVSITDVWMFYLFVGGFGIGYSICMTSESPLVAWLFGVRSHGVLLGILSFGFTIGAATGPFLAGYIFDMTGSYQAAFLTFAVFTVVGLILVALIRPVIGAINKVG